MHNGNPKLTCNDETCDVCAKVFKDIVQTLPRCGYRCEECRNRLKQENISAEKEFYKLRSEKLQSNRDFIAEDIGWQMLAKDHWVNRNTNEIAKEHPISINDVNSLMKFVPEGWIMRYDYEDIMAYDARRNTDLPIENRYINNPRYFHNIVSDYHGITTGESFDSCLIHDILEMIVEIRKLENEEKNK